MEASFLCQKQESSWIFNSSFFIYSKLLFPYTPATIKKTITKSIYIYIYVIHRHTHTHIYIYIYIFQDIYTHTHTHKGWLNNPPPLTPLVVDSLNGYFCKTSYVVLAQAYHVTPSAQWKRCWILSTHIPVAFAYNATDACSLSSFWSSQCSKVYVDSIINIFYSKIKNKNWEPIFFFFQ